ncbi:OLC1v1014182C1 [Oldenlandia corymbosa var. corymbosa]|uniref:OLC1v1014182C1 n=1 Tax=Oldenlandia corymbosa var. corymbosa TaxID=529605 RepID=A0AAV1E2L7_OLDCO|nr:OLC1v1014182C1 [Oldenlandia corymbosa var. corymbosa]
MAAAKVAISSSSSSLCIKFAPTQKFSPSLLPHISSSSPKRKKINFSRISARLGGEEGDAKQGGKKKFITRDEEPEQYWQTAGEREGENPMKTPLPYIIIFGITI